MYPDKEAVDKIFDKKDKVILTDIKFSELKEIDKTGNKRYRYPDEIKIIAQLGNIDELVVGGFHYSSCVKRVAETGLSMGINSIVDLDLTDLFFNLHKDKEYFEINEYNPEKFRKRFYRRKSKYGEEFLHNLFLKNYSSPAYGFNNETNLKCQRLK